MSSKILIVDDTPKNIQVLGNLLREHGYELEFALRGKEALKWLERSNFDLVMLDVMMPEMDGYEVCEIVRKQEKYNNLPIIFLTAKNDAESVLQGFQSGGQDFVSKPFNSKELLARVKTHVELKQSKEKLEGMNEILEQQVKERTASLHEANIELDKLNKDLINIDKEKSEFLTLISHEIRTPLHGINGFLQVLQSMADDDEVHELLSYMDSSAYRLERFSKLALLITQLRTNQRKPKQEPIDFCEAFEILKTKKKKLIDESGVRLHIEFPASDFTIQGDNDLFNKCLDSIVENAIHYSKNGDEVKISCLRKNKKNSIQITDMGPGFSDKALKNLFKLFATDTKEADNHVGLDLALAKMIMDKHKGEINIWNNRVGATVELVFNNS